MSADARLPAAFALGAAIGAATAAAATYYYCCCCGANGAKRRAAGAGAGAPPPPPPPPVPPPPPLPFSDGPLFSSATTTALRQSKQPSITLRDHHSTDEILREQLSRNRQFFAETDGQARLARSRVVVVGLGGVGSHAAHMLLRAGVGALRLVDFDQVSLSSLSRHATATRADVGLPKTEALARRLREIMPEAEIETRNEMFTAEGADRILGRVARRRRRRRQGAGGGGGGRGGGGVCGDDGGGVCGGAAHGNNGHGDDPDGNGRHGNDGSGDDGSGDGDGGSSDGDGDAPHEERIDFVIDAIDNIGTKVDLVAACRARGLEVLCCAGAGAKADPTRLRFADLSESAYDPLARALRKQLRRRHPGAGLAEGVTILLSTEAPRCGLVAACEGEAAADAAALARAAAEAARRSAAAEAGGGGGGGAADATVAVASLSTQDAGGDGAKNNNNPLADYQVVPNFRVRIIPVLGTTPAVFGQAAAAHALCRLAGAPFDGEPIALYTALQYGRAADRLLERERRRFGTGEGLALDHDDVVYLLRELWRGYSARLGERGRVAAAVGGTRGLMRSTAGLAFTRWDASRPATVDNVVLLTAEEADAHDALFGGLGGGQDGGEEGEEEDGEAGLRPPPSAGDAARVLEALAAREPEFCAHVEAMLERARRDHWRVQLA